MTVDEFIKAVRKTGRGKGDHQIRFFLFNELEATSFSLDQDDNVVVGFAKPYQDELHAPQPVTRAIMTFDGPEYTGVVVDGALVLPAAPVVEEDVVDI